MQNFKNFKCVLLIDDDKVINYYNQKVISKYSDFGEVVSVNNGIIGLNYLKEAILGKTIKPDVVFLDINMPAMDGWDFIEEFKKLDKNFTSSIHLILLTTSSNPDDFIRSKSFPEITTYINKPLSKEILESISKIISKNFEMKVLK